MSVKHQENFFSEEELPWIVREKIIPLLAKNIRIILLYGPIGVGKTALVKEVAFQLGVNSSVKSPTFGYVNTYQVGQFLGKKSISLLCHFDLYRLAGEEGLVAAGFDECIANSEALVMVEWPGAAEYLVWQEGYVGMVCKIRLSYDGQNKNRRKVSIEAA